jgi:hypothetical protein
MFEFKSAEGLAKTRSAASSIGKRLDSKALLTSFSSRPWNCSDIHARTAMALATGRFPDFVKSDAYNGLILSRLGWLLTRSNYLCTSWAGSG